MEIVDIGILLKKVILLPKFLIYGLKIMLDIIDKKKCNNKLLKVLIWEMEMINNWNEKFD